MAALESCLRWSMTREIVVKYSLAAKEPMLSTSLLRD